MIQEQRESTLVPPLAVVLLGWWGVGREGVSVTGGTREVKAAKQGGVEQGPGCVVPISLRELRPCMPALAHRSNSHRRTWCRRRLGLRISALTDAWGCIHGTHRAVNWRTVCAKFGNVE